MSFACRSVRASICHCVRLVAVASCCVTPRLSLSVAPLIFTYPRISHFLVVVVVFVVLFYSFPVRARPQPFNEQTATGEAQVDKTITIKPGWKDGTKITYKEEGDEQPGMLPAGAFLCLR